MRTVCLLYGCQCNTCCERVERAVRRIPGVTNAEANLYRATLTVEHDDTCACRDIIAAVERIGYLAEIARGDSSIADAARSPPAASSRPPSNPLPRQVPRPPTPRPPTPPSASGGTAHG